MLDALRAVRDDRDQQLAVDLGDVELAVARSRSGTGPRSDRAMFWMSLKLSGMKSKPFSRYV